MEICEIVGRPISFQNAHLAMIDGLMTAHMREVISVERVVEAVKYVLFYFRVSKNGRKGVSFF